ncbi:MAG: hypothetical protein V1495_06455 [Pseudomonadota bacterium]
MEDDVGIVLVNPRRLASPLFALCFFLGCSDSGPTSPPPISTDWKISVDGKEASLTVTEITAKIQGDAGVVLRGSGVLGGETFSLSIDIAGAAPIGSLPATLSVGGSAVGVTLKIGESKNYRGTGGQIVFTAYGGNEGDSIAGTADLTLAGLAISPKSFSAFSGSFSITATIPR